MLRPLQKFEDALARAESYLLTFFVLLMLSLAVYNVFYRNVLVPVQVKADHAANADATPAESPNDESDSVKENAPEEGEAADEPTDDEGFGGGFADDDEPSEPADDDNGFGGGFGEDEPTEKLDKPADDEGFGGGFGDDGADVGLATESDSGEGGFGGGFGDEGEQNIASVQVDDTPFVEPTQSGVGALIEAIKLEWIDVLLRHLVLIVGFLGAMLATRRRKHITIDALSKIIRGRTLIISNLVTTALSLAICIMLGLAGLDLVQLGLEFPKELSWWVDEWHLQLVFPIGFGFLSFHFFVRLVECFDAARTGDDSIFRDTPIRPDAITVAAGGEDGHLTVSEEQE